MDYLATMEEFIPKTHTDALFNRVCYANSVHPTSEIEHSIATLNLHRPL